MIFLRKLDDNIGNMVWTLSFIIVRAKFKSLKERVTIYRFNSFIRYVGVVLSLCNSLHMVKKEGFLDLIFISDYFRDKYVWIDVSELSYDDIIIKVIHARWIFNS